MNRNTRIVIVVVGLVLVLCGLPLGAQDDAACPDIVRSALEATHNACDGTGRNQACYGNVTLEAQSMPDITDLAFGSPGDIADVAGIQSLRLSSLDEADQEWGVALMRVQANLPNTLPGQNVTFLLFGDVEIENRAPPLTEIVVTRATRGNLNVRAGPSTDFAVVGVLLPEETVSANGRDKTGEWLRIVLGDGVVGWVSAPLVRATGNLTALPLARAGEAVYGPMQAFYFRSGIGDAPCDAAPSSGILIQTPQGAGEINLLVNEVNLTLGSTAYLQAQVGAELIVNVVEGRATVESFVTEQVVPAGSYVTVPLDAELKAAGPPGPTRRIDDDRFRSLPIELLSDPVDEVSVLAVASELEDEPAAEVTSEPFPAGGGGVFVMPGGAQWADSGISVTAGQVFTITASGQVNVFPTCERDRTPDISPCSEFIVTPNGWSHTPQQDDYVVAQGWVDEFTMPNERMFMLLGRIGSGGEPFAVGTGGTFTADGTGTLQFIINDTDVSDNEGELTVEIVVNE